MALLTYNGTNYDNHLGTTTIAATNTTVTSAGIFSATFTAPNTTNAVTGVWIYINSFPNSGCDFRVTLQEATVDTACTTTILNADMRFGWNYVRFPTPYVFTATTAGRYRFKVNNTVAITSGTLALSASLFAYTATYDSTTATPAVGDDVWVGGFHNGGLTPVTNTLTGTSNSFGSGTDTTMVIATTRSIGAGLTIGNGGKLKLDDAASSSVQIRGSVFITAGGIFEAIQTDKTKTINIIMDNHSTNGDYGIMTASGAVGGQVLFEGAERDVYTTYSSGSGTAASPFIVSSAVDWDVGDEIVIGSSNGYLENEVRHIITRNSSTSFVFSSTSGGAETALTYTHTAGVHVALLTRNVIIKPTNTARGMWLYNVGGATLGHAYQYSSTFDWTRWEYASAASGDGINIENVNSSGSADGLVSYYNSVANRSSIIWGNTKTTRTVRGQISFEPLSTNGAGVGGLSLTGTANHTFDDCFQFTAPGSTASGVHLALASNAVNNVFNNCHSYGGNANGTGGNSAWQIYGCAFNTFNSCTINGARIQGWIFATATDIVLNDFHSGNFSQNNRDIYTPPNNLNTVLFSNSTFTSSTLLYLPEGQLEGSLIRFHKFQQTDNRHRWYTINGSAFSSGTGLDETTVATSDSLACALIPTTSTGIRFQYRIPVNVGEVISVFGKFWCDSTFLADSGSTLTAELFLPGSLEADQTVTMTKTTDPDSNDAVFRLGLVNTSAVKDVAIVRLTAKGTAGGKAFVDDLNGGTNPISSLDIWYEGQPLAFQLSPQTLGDAAATAAAVWGYTTAGAVAGTMGKLQVDTDGNAELAAIK